MSSHSKKEIVGDTVSHYRILNKLGGGGMGVVYEAEDTRLKRHVALKFLPPDLTRDDEAKQRFILEAQAASALDHPNVCTIHEIDEADDGRLFIVMACYAGETLKTRLQQGALSLNEALNVAIQAARGLACAHEAGIVHRDIKPANLMLTARGEVKILDFSLAKLARQGGVTRTGLVLGTVAYMAPEQIKGGEIDPRVDVWALGVVLYEMLTGKHPFARPEESAILNAVLNEQPPSLRELRTDLPERVVNIVERALRRDKNARYSSAAEMLAELSDCQTQLSEATAVRPQSSLSILRKPAIAIPVVALLLAIAAVAGISIRRAANVRWARENRRSDSSCNKTAILRLTIWRQRLKRTSRAIAPCTT